MQQVLFHIPLIWWDIPIYGYGFMLFIAFIFCVWLGSRLAKQKGIDPRHIQDLAIWVFLFGIAGARAVYMIQFGVPLQQFFFVWDGGLVFYGSAIGGMVGYFLYYGLVLRKHHVSTWKMADVIAPCVALGLAIGRLGCLLNGCCYGAPACSDCLGMSFPLASAPRAEMVKRGWQTAAGFTLRDNSNVVEAVEPGSGAAKAGLKPGDQIKELLNMDNETRYASTAQNLDAYFDTNGWPRGKNNLQLVILRDGNTFPLEPFDAWTVRLNPTQLYETISMGLLFFLLMSYLPFNRRDGSVMVLMMLCYAVHRYFNEMLRDDTPVVAFGLTLSQLISIVLLAGGLVFAFFVWRRPPNPKLQPG